MVIQLAGGKPFTILKDPVVHWHYIRSVHFNGQSYPAFEIGHDALVQGGTLSFTMADEALVAGIKERTLWTAPPNGPSRKKKGVDRKLFFYL